MIKVKQWIITPNLKLMFEATLPGKMIVCPCCNGQGTIVNPAIDYDGLSDEDCQDKEFMDNYMSGTYDITCTECQGRNVVAVLDWERLSPKMQKAVERAEAQIRADEAEAAGERRMGA
jgi:DnaJ-class molecular chaperone